MNPIKERLTGGAEVIGTFVRITCPEVAEILIHAGFDFVVVDGEHSPTDDGAIGTVVRAADAAGAVALVRPPACEPSVVGRLLETGARGVHLPQLQDARAAELALRAVRYPPLGTRGAAIGRSGGYGLSMSLADYIETANRDMITVAQVESAQALDEIADIASLPGLDVVFLGLTDLTVDYGIPGEYGHPRISEALSRAQRAAESAGVALGVPVTDGAMLARMRAAGARYFTANDVRLLGAGARHFLREVR